MHLIKRLRLKAFTLSEVLITLGIIGVVAAMTLPAIINKTAKKQAESQIKVCYSIIQQAVNFSKADNVTDPELLGGGNIVSLTNWFNTYMKPYLKVTKTCYNQPGCWHKYGEVKTLDNAAPIWENRIGSGDSIIGTSALTFSLPNGTLYNLNTSLPGNTSNIFGVDLNTSSLQFYFDINGKKKPNIIGKDIYILNWTKKGLVPAGNDRSKEEVEDNCLNGNGYWCLKKVIQDGWQIDDRVWNR